MDRFPAFLERIIAALTKNERTFTDLEEVKLVQVMGLSPENVQILIDACTLIFERAARHSSTVADLSTLLGQAGLSTDLVAAFQDAWELRGTALIGAFKERCLGAPGHSLLLDIGWRINLQVAGRNFSQICEPSAILQLGLAKHDKLKESEEHTNLVLEFSNDELFSMYEKLEQIQEQLDHLA